MKKRLEVDEIDASEMQQLVQVAVENATSDLQHEVAELRRRLHEQRRVISHKEAVAFFGGEVSAETVARKCREGTIPANKRGRIWYIETRDLFDWLAGAGDDE